MSPLARVAGRGLALCVLAQLLVGIAGYLRSLTVIFALLLLFTLMRH